MLLLFLLIVLFTLITFYPQTRASLTLCGDCKECGGSPNITIPDPLTSVVDFAFDNCGFLKSVFIPT